MEDMDDQNEISLTINELHLLQAKEKTSNSGEQSTSTSTSAKMDFNRRLEPIYNVNTNRIYNSRQQQQQQQEGNGNNFYENSDSLRHCFLKALQTTQYAPKILRRKMGARTEFEPMARIRLRPYWVRQRSRTHSETADSATLAQLEQIRVLANTTPIDSPMDFMDTSNSNFNNNNIFSLENRLRDLSTSGNNTILLTKVQALKKSKSLEDIRSENLDGSQPSHEMEFVSSRIQKLKVQE